MITFSGHVEPMLGVLSKPFFSPDLQYEIKWDGYRAIAYLDPEGDVRLESRNLRPLLPRFPHLVSLRDQVRHKMILDGEIVSFVDGKPNFQALTKGQGQITYLPFDLLWLSGKDLTDLPLWRRQELLFAEGERLAISPPLEIEPLEALKQAEQMGLEGIMAKERQSRYSPGKRSRAWLKFKVRRKNSVVLGGYKMERGLAILAGAWREKELRYLGKVGTGFTKAEEGKLLELFHKIEMSLCPFQPLIPQGDSLWLEPVLTGKIEYLELTEEGLLRHPSWLGLSAEKSLDILWEDFK
jgi:DNA ligase D-like protein (predicted ligase)